MTHVDYSARIQTVDAQRNPLLFKLLTRFHEQTGCPVLINTSFNVRSEPIVCTPGGWRSAASWRPTWTCWSSAAMSCTRQEQKKKVGAAERAKHLAQFQLD